jgi:hypothetical protein
MMAEAIRLSLADEEERRKKAEKEARKEAKKREKEERKAAKKKGEVYGSGSASASSLSLGLGRRRNNSGTSNLRVEASVAAATASAAQGPEPSSPTHDKGKGVERGNADEMSTATAGSSPIQPIPISQVPRGMSHLRQMSNASSISSDGLDSMHGSYSGRSGGAEDPHGSALSLEGQSSQGDSAGSEPLFNFRSLAEVVGVSITGEGGQSEGSNHEHQSKLQDHAETHGEHIEHAVAAPTSITKVESDSGLRIETSGNVAHTGIGHERRVSTPGVVVTPETPVPVDNDHEDSKRLGHFDTEEGTREVTQ